MATRDGKGEATPQGDGVDVSLASSSWSVSTASAKTTIPRRDLAQKEKKEEEEREKETREEKRRREEIRKKAENRIEEEEKNLASEEESSSQPNRLIWFSSYLNISENDYSFV
jgi:hypothetical protein